MQVVHVYNIDCYMNIFKTKNTLKHLSFHNTFVFNNNNDDDDP